MPLRNGLHMSGVNLKYFVGMFLKVSTLEKFKSSIYFSASALSMPEN